MEQVITFKLLFYVSFRQGQCDPYSFYELQFHDQLFSLWYPSTVALM
jgi:hypothetical protein